MSQANYTGQPQPIAAELEPLRAQMTAELGQRYVLETYLGRGAFATVWRASDVVTGTRVAVKCFAPCFGQGHDFYNELSIHLRLAHENIVRLINLTDAPGGRYLILEYCAGGSLRAALSRARRQGQRCPPEQALDLALQLAEGLAAAHRLDLTHRDLKPENILFATYAPRPFAGSARVKLADFGLARVVSKVKRRGTGGLGAMSGSPAYMAPEQFAGTYHSASDLYALGVVLYELLHDRLPYEGTVEELALQHLHEAPRFDSHLEQFWIELLTRLLDKEPERRPTATAAVALLTQARRSSKRCWLYIRGSNTEETT